MLYILQPDKVVLFREGLKVMQLEGVDAATVTVEELQEVLEDDAWQNVFTEHCGKFMNKSKFSLPRF